MDANPIRCVVTFAVPPDGVDEVREIVSDLVAAAGTVPVHTLSPEFDDGTGVLALTVEFAGPDEVDASLAGLGPDLARLAARAPRRELHVFGELPAGARAALDRFEPTFHASAG